MISNRVIEAFRSKFSAAWVNRVSRVMIAPSSVGLQDLWREGATYKELGDAASAGGWLAAIRPDNPTYFTEIAERTAFFMVSKGGWGKFLEELQANKAHVRVVLMPSLEDPEVLDEIMGFELGTTARIGVEACLRGVAEKFNLMARSPLYRSAVYLANVNDEGIRNRFFLELTRVYDTLPVLLPGE